MKKFVSFLVIFAVVVFVGCSRPVTGPKTPGTVEPATEESATEE